MAGVYSLGDLRKVAEASGFTGSDEQLILETAKRGGRDPADLARYLGYDTGGKWSSRLGASVDSYQANLYGLGEAVTGSDWLRRQRQENEAGADLRRNIARSQGAVQSYKDINGVGDFFDYAGGLAVDSAPYLGEALVGGLAVRGLSGGLRAAAAAGRAGDATVDAVRAGQAAEAALGRRSLAGGVVASYPSAVGDILSNQREAGDGNTMDLGAALAGGVPYAALNAFGLEGMAARGGLGRGVAALDNMTGKRGVAARLGTSMSATALSEGLGETGQEMVNQRFGRMVTNTNETMFSDGAMDRYAESFVGGALLGGMGAAPGGWRRSQEYQNREVLEAALGRERAAMEAARTQEEAAAAAARAAEIERVLANIRPEGRPTLDLLNSRMAPAPLSGGARAAREAEYESMFAEPTNQFTVDPNTGYEVPVDLGQHIDLMDRSRYTRNEAEERRQYGLPLLGYDPRAKLTNQLPDTIPVTRSGEGLLNPDEVYRQPALVQNIMLRQRGVSNPEARWAEANAASQPTQLSPDRLNEILGVRPPPDTRSRMADVNAAISEPGMRFVDENQVEVVGDRLRDNERQLGITQAIQQRVQEKKALNERATTAIGFKPGNKHLEAFETLEAMERAGTISEDEMVEQVANIGAGRMPAVKKFIEAKTNATSATPQPAGSVGPVPGSTPAQGNQPAAGTRVVRAGSGVSLPAARPADTAAPDAGGGSNPVVAASGQPGRGGAAAQLTGPYEVGAGRDLTPDELVGKPDNRNRDAEAVFRRSLSEALAASDPDDRQMLERWLGVKPLPDGSLDLTDTETLEEIGADIPNPQNGGKLGISKEAVRKKIHGILRRMGAPVGISPKDLRSRLGLQIAGTTLDDMERHVDPTLKAGDATKRDAKEKEYDTVEEQIAAVEAEAADTERSTALDGDNASADVKEGAVDERVVQGDDAVGADENGPATDADANERAVEGSRAAKRAAEEVSKEGLQSILKGDLASGRVQPEHIAEAEFIYDKMRPAGWRRLNDLDRATFIRGYARQRAAGSPEIDAALKEFYATGRSGPQADTAAARPAPGGTEGSGGDVNVSEGTGVTGGVAGDEVPGAGTGQRGPAPAVVVKKKRSVDAAALSEGRKQREDAARMVVGSKPVIKEAKITNPDSGVNTLDPAEFAGVRNAKALIDKFITVAKDGPLVDLARQLARSHVLGSVRVEFTKAGDVPSAEVVRSFNSGAGAVAAVGDGGVTLYFRTDLNGAFREDVIVHEVVHAVTEAALQRNPAFRTELSKLAATIGYSLSERAGFSKDSQRDAARDFWRKAVGKDAGEMLAYALTSPSYRKALSDFAADGKPFGAYRSQEDLDAVRQGPNPGKPTAEAPKPLTLWQRTVDLFRRMFGLAPLHKQAFDRAVDAYVDAQAQYAKDSEAFNTLMPLQARLEDALRRLTADTEARGAALTSGEVQQAATENSPVGRDEVFRRLRRLAREAYTEFDSPNDAFDAMLEAASAPEKAILRALQADDFLGFDYPHQALDEVRLIMEGSEYAGDYELSPRLKAAISRLGNQTFKYSSDTVDTEPATPKRPQRSETAQRVVDLRKRVSVLKALLECVAS